MDRLNDVVAISNDQIKCLLEEYDIGDLREHTLFSNGIINSNYHVITSEGSYLLRIYTQDRDMNGIKFEVSTLNHLSKHGVLVQQPIADKHNDIIGSFNDHYFVLLSFIEGDVLELENTNAVLCYQVGAQLAKIQNLLDDFKPEGSKPNADFEFIDELNTETYKKLNSLGNPGIHEYERIKNDWDELAKCFRTPAINHGFVHADIYCENTIVEGNNLKAFIDFDDSYFGVMLYDLSLVLMEFSIIEEGNMNFDFIGHLINGYTQQREITQQEQIMLFDSMRFLCFKYLSYTSGLEEYSFEALLDNPYLLRLSYFRNEDVKEKFNQAVISNIYVVGIKQQEDEG